MRPSGRFAVCFAALCAALSAGACGGAATGYEQLRDFLDNPAPIQIWSGKVTGTQTGGDPIPLPGIVVVIEARLDPPPNPTDEQIKMADEKLAVYSGVTDTDGIYRIFYRWYEDRRYTLHFVPLKDSPYVTDSSEPGHVLWQDHDTDMLLTLSGSP
jgi:hypothetical protein